jgi:hypothetical protein
MSGAHQSKQWVCTAPCAGLVGHWTEASSYLHVSAALPPRTEYRKQLDRRLGVPEPVWALWKNPGCQEAKPDRLAPKFFVRKHGRLLDCNAAHSTRRYKPQDSHLHTRCPENVKSYLNTGASVSRLPSHFVFKHPIPHS